VGDKYTYVPYSWYIFVYVEDCVSGGLDDFDQTLHKI